MIALRGLSFVRTVKLDISKQMLIAVLDSQDLLPGNIIAVDAAAAFPVGFADVAKKIKAAAGTMRASASPRTMHDPNYSMQYLYNSLASCAGTYN